MRKKAMLSFVFRSVFVIILSVLMCFGIINFFFRTAAPYYMLFFLPYTICSVVFVILACFLYHYFLLQEWRVKNDESKPRVKTKTKVLSFLGLFLAGTILSVSLITMNVDFTVLENVTRSDDRFFSAMKIENYCSFNTSYTSENKLSNSRLKQMEANEYIEFIDFPDSSGAIVEITSFVSSCETMAYTLFKEHGRFLSSGMPPEEYFIGDAENPAYYEHLEGIEHGYYFTDGREAVFVCQNAGVYLKIEITGNYNLQLIISKDTKERCMEQFELLRKTL